ncbi:hypothetical protein [Microbacterium sp. WCS2018Hpa-9]|uniref:hypothetical protein n=1 Tax=Microbacterium sp. WCS2018Hpa-9 TaxID=3073635 RepID=UPI00288BA7C5|nr:hypothetical protein [Microbacterium sp. WCS2018Hpa-9]
MTEATELPASMGKVARRELALQGLTRLDQFDGVSESALLAIHGVGPKAIRLLREELESRGSALRP